MNTPKTRPYWHVDLKWMFGILAFLSLWGALLMNAFATLTERQNATEVTSSFVSNIFKSNNVDVSATIAQLKAQAAFLPDDAVISLPNLPSVKITKSDLMTKSNEEIQKLAIDQLTGPIYDQGLDKTASDLTQNTTEQKSFKQQAGILGVISKQTHDFLSLASKVVLATSLIWFTGLIYFSAGWGRIVSPGVVLVAVSPVGVVIGGLLELLAKKNESLLNIVPQSVMSNLATAINGTYRTAMLAGIGLLVAAGIGKLITDMRRKPTPKV